MKKLLFTLALSLMIVTSLFAQSFELTPYTLRINDKTEIVNKHLINPSPQTAGDYLIRSKNKMFVGTGITIGGTYLTIVGLKNSIENSNYTSSPLVYVGGATTLIGIIMYYSGINDIGKAGLLLNENGVGIKIKIK